MQMRLVTDYLDNTVERFPNKIAYIDSKRAITFGQLHTEANKIAGELVSNGFFKSPIAIYLEKSVECISSFVGCAYSGNFYTPIDVKMPIERVSKIINTLQPKVIITDSEHKTSIQTVSKNSKIILYEECQKNAVDFESVKVVTEKIIDSDVLYVLFTSGSTGEPKGVIIPHCSAVDYVDWITDRFCFDENIVIGNQAPLYFDLSIQDVYAPLKSGCTTVLIDERNFTFPAKLMQYLVEMNVNTIVWVPSALCLFANLRALNTKKQLPDLKYVLFCGEVMPNKQLNQWRKAFPSTIFVNMYGPTESCDASTYYVVNRAFEDSESLPIGIPCKNTDILVLNEENRLVTEKDKIGELCVRGTSLALGYYKDFDKTNKSFVQNPLNCEYPEKIYRTGDLVYYNEYGELMYSCRKDFQIKHMGHRIELGEIETAVSSLEGIHENCALYDSTNDKIVLFYSGRTINDEIVLSAVKNLVPHYMVPEKLVSMKTLPHNLNGKIDRALLKKSLEV